MIISFNIPDAQLPRVKDAVRVRLLPNTTPTDQELLAEFKSMLREYIKSQVAQHELQEQQRAVVEAYTHLTVTDEP